MHLASSSARRIFDVVITSAQKPAFYNRDRLGLGLGLGLAIPNPNPNPNPTPTPNPNPNPNQVFRARDRRSGELVAIKVAYPA